MDSSACSSQTKLTNDPAEDIDPAWSPDGSQIAFARGTADAHEIYAVSANGSGSA